MLRLETPDSESGLLSTSRLPTLYVARRFPANPSAGHRNIDLQGGWDAGRLTQQCGGKGARVTKGQTAV